jgi:hypothetical protein
MSRMPANGITGQGTYASPVKAQQHASTNTFIIHRAPASNGITPEKPVGPGLDLNFVNRQSIALSGRKSSQKGKNTHRIDD